MRKHIPLQHFSKDVQIAAHMIGLDQPEIDRRERRISTLQACLKEQPKRARALGYPERIKAEKEEVKKLRAKQRDERAAFERKKREFAQGETLAQKLRKNAEVLTDDK